VTVSGLVELTLEVRDLRAAEGFYVDVFGLRILRREADRVWLDAGGGARLGLWLPGEKEFGDEGGRHVHFAFGAEPDALDTLVARLGARGIPVRGPVEHPGGDRSIYLSDPEGNVVEVWDFFERGQGAQRGTDALAKQD
jgi:catechol-2,3-dioxygenase